MATKSKRKTADKQGTSSHREHRLVSGSSERLAMEMLRTDMRITDARLSDAIDHEEGLRALHDAANDRVALLRSIKRDLQARADSICPANDKVRDGGPVASDSARDATPLG